MLNLKSFKTDESYYAYIRFFHALALETPVNVDIYVNNDLVISNLSYESFTNYLTAYPGSYEIKLYPTGNKTDLLLNAHVVLSPNMIYTAAIVGTSDDVGLEVIDDVVRNSITTKSHMRFANLSETSEAVNIYIDGILVVEDLAYLDLTDYLSLKSGRHTMRVTISKTGQTVVSHPNLQLIAGNYYMTYVVGILSSRPEIEVVIPLEGTSYLYSKAI